MKWLRCCLLNVNHSVIVKSLQLLNPSSCFYPTSPCCFLSLGPSLSLWYPHFLPFLLHPIMLEHFSIREIVFGKGTTRCLKQPEVLVPEKAACSLICFLFWEQQGELTWTICKTLSCCGFMLFPSETSQQQLEWKYGRKHQCLLRCIRSLKISFPHIVLQMNPLPPTAVKDLR